MAKQNEKVFIPDIGGASDIDVIEVFVKAGDTIAKDDSLLTLEGDKATMEVPSTVSGVVKKVAVKVGDKVSEGSLIVEVETKTAEKEEAGETDEPAEKKEKAAEKESGKTEESTEKKEQAAEKEPGKVEEPAEKKEQIAKKEPAEAEKSAGPHAGPAVRRLAHEFDIDLAAIVGTGEKGRVLKEDLKAYLKQGESVASVDFSRFGEIEKKPLSRIQKISGAALHRNWMSIPHITQFDEADVTDLEAFRQQQKSKHNLKLTPLVFIMKAVVAALKAFPHFNASLDAGGQQLVLKKYFHIGVAVDTPNGLVVPVIRDVDQKSLSQLATELTEISQKARKTGLGMNDMQGGCFSISSLGGIGGTAFSPIINAPEVAILGVSRTQTKPIYDQESQQWVPRLMLPLALSYDHRVIDGADGARFIVYLSERLLDIRTLLL